MRYKLDKLTGEIIDTEGTEQDLNKYYDLNCIQDAEQIVDILNKYDIDSKKLGEHNEH
jgi:hypothetical protein